MMEKIVLRMADIFDLLPITLMWQKLNKETFPDVFVIDEEELKAFSHTLASRLLLPTAFTMVAEDKNRVIGFTHGYLQVKPYGKPKAIGFSEFSYVEKKYRKQGIGKRLAVNFYNWAKEHGAEAVEFVTKYDVKLAKQWEKEGCFPYAIIYREKSNKWKQDAI